MMTLANRKILPFNKPNRVIERIPIPELDRTDADVALIAVAMGLTQYAPINDPLFKATTVFNDTSMSVPIYLPDSPSGTLGCAVQASLLNSYQDLGLTRPSTKPASHVPVNRTTALPSPA